MPDATLAITQGLVGCTPRESIELAREAAGWGYRAAWASEVDGPDAFSMLGALAVATDLDLGVAVVPVQTRTAFVLGMSAATVAHLAPGRFSLGIGASSEVLVSRFGGQPFEQPLRWVRETVEALRPLLRGERTTLEGRFVRIGGYRYPIPPPEPVPIFLGSLNPKSLRLAGAVADGLCLNQCAPHHVPRMLDEVRAGAKDAGRELPDPFPVMARLFCLVTDQPDAAREVVRSVFAPYVATSVYNRFYRWMGYEEEAEGIARAAAARDKEAMVAAFSDRVARDLFLIGDAAEVIEGVRAYVEAGVSIPVIAPLAPGPGPAAETLRAVADGWRRDE